MSDLIRDAPVGHIIRWVTRNRVLLYPEERPGFQYPSTYKNVVGKEKPPLPNIDNVLENRLRSGSQETLAAARHELEIIKKVNEDNDPDDDPDDDRPRTSHTISWAPRPMPSQATLNPDDDRPRTSHTISRAPRAMPSQATLDPDDDRPRTSHTMSRTARPMPSQATLVEGRTARPMPSQSTLGEPEPRPDRTARPMPSQATLVENRTARAMPSQTTLAETETRQALEQQFANAKQSNLPIVPAKLDDGTVLVDWYDTEDPANPQNWSLAKKLFTMTLIWYVSAFFFFWFSINFRVKTPFHSICLSLAATTDSIQVCTHSPCIWVVPSILLPSKV